MAQMRAHHEMMGHGMGMMNVRVPSTTSVEDIPNGARLVLGPRDPARLAELRGEAREQARRMNAGGCPMMSGSATASRECPP